MGSDPGYRPDLDRGELPISADGDMSPSKRPRLYLARQACENCRRRKARCDEDFPCSSCRNAGVECVFSERKATKNEASLGMIFNALRRIESKVDSNQFATAPARPKKDRIKLTDILGSPSGNPESLGSQNAVGSISSPCDGSLATPDASTSAPAPAPAPPPVPAYTTYSYDSHRVILWPAIRSILIQNIPKLDQELPDHSYGTHLEQTRAPLSPYVGTESQANYLSQLSILNIKALIDDYFATWNLAHPILDRDMFNQHTMNVAINSDFGYNIESCLLLVVLALGCRGRQALKDGGFQSSSDKLSGSSKVTSPNAPSAVPWDPPARLFFDEARKRTSFLLCDNSMQSCQYYMLSGLYYAQAWRPADWWSMTNRAGVCCMSFWENVPPTCDDWILDMQARLYWMIVMFEAVLTQEFDFPVSNILNYEDRVPLPRFIKPPGISLAPAFTGTASHTSTEDLSFCHYHLLAQIAHRRILTRARNSMFSQKLTDRERHRHPPSSTVLTDMSTSSDYPPQAVEDEILHQFEQWRQQLPDALQFSDKISEPVAPRDFLVVPWLQGRYLIAQYHIRKPLLHKALHHPKSLTPVEMQRCRVAVSCILEWAPVMKPTLVLECCSPLRYLTCTVLFGQFVLLYCFNHGDPILREMLPEGYVEWCHFAVEEIQKGAAHSPVLAKDAELVTMLHESTGACGLPCLDIRV